MTPKAAERWKLLGALAALGVATAGFVRFYKSSNPEEGKAYFYDLGAKKLFTAPHSSIPPIKGIEGEEEDGVRAVVITVNGDCKDEASRRVAYLETYTAELKRQLELRKRNDRSMIENAPATIQRGQAHSFILVKRPDEADWHPMTTPEGQEIMNILNTPGPGGQNPVVCVP